MQLAEAHDYALDVQVEPWQFAMEIESLVAQGVTASDLDWLVQGGYAEHAREVTRPGDSAPFRTAARVELYRRGRVSS